MPIDPEFMALVAPLYREGMGTEQMAPLLYSMICFTRPRSLLEIGAGYTTPFLARAAQDSLRSWREEAKQSDNPILVEDHFTEDYAPHILCIDNHTHPGSTSACVQEVLSAAGLDGFVEFVEADFTKYSDDIEESHLPFDFVWFDCGALPEYFLFFHHYWRFVNPDGGLLLMHSTLTNLEINTFIKSIKLSQATTEFDNMELLSLLEPHKKFQNSVTLFRKTVDCKEPIYSIRP